ncbi:MAG: hypothetical protein ACYSSM_06140 [Planctomycetota bacterium]|jgi:hypothetical protein
MGECLSESYRESRLIAISVVTAFALFLLTAGSCEYYNSHLEVVRYEKVAEMVKDGAEPIEAAMAVDAIDADIKNFLLIQKSGE